MRTVRHSHELARRLEHASQTERRAYLQLHRTVYPDRVTDCLEVGGATATVCGSHVAGEVLGHRAFSRCVGLGFDSPVTSAMLDQIEQLYETHGVPPRVDVCPLADGSLLERLRERGYVIESFINTWIRDASGTDHEPGPGVRVAVATNEQRELWCQTMGRGFAGRDDIPTDPIADVMSRFEAKTHFLAFIDDEPAGAAAAQLSDGLGLVNGAATRARFRRRGVQQALLAARIDHIAEHSELLALTSSPGSASERNIERFGFEVLYTKPIAVGPQPKNRSCQGEGSAY